VLYGFVMEPAEDPLVPIHYNGTYETIHNLQPMQQDASCIRMDDAPGSTYSDHTSTAQIELALPNSFLNSIAPLDSGRATDSSSNIGAKKGRPPKRTALDFVRDDEGLLTGEQGDNLEHVKKKARGAPQKRGLPQKSLPLETAIVADIGSKGVMEVVSLQQPIENVTSQATVGDAQKKGGWPKGRRRLKPDNNGNNADADAPALGLRNDFKVDHFAREQIRFSPPLILNDTSIDDLTLRSKLSTAYFSPLQQNDDDSHFGIIVDQNKARKGSSAVSTIKLSTSRHSCSSSSSSSSGVMKLLQSEEPSRGGGAFHLRGVPYKPSTYDELSFVSQELEINTSQYPEPVFLPHQYTLPADTRQNPPEYSYSHLVPTVNRLRAEILPMHALPRAKLFESLSCRIAASAPLHVVPPDCELGDEKKDLLRMAWPKTDKEIPESIPSIGNVWRYCVKTSEQRKRTPWWQLAEHTSGLELLEEAEANKAEADMKASKEKARAAMIAAYAVAGMQPPPNAESTRVKAVADEIIAPRSKVRGVDDTTQAVRHFFASLLTAENEATTAAASDSCFSSSSSASRIYEHIVPFVVDSGEESESRWLLDVLNGRAAATKVLVRTVQRDLEFNDLMYEAKMRKRNVKRLKETLVTESHKRRAGLAQRAVHDLSLQRKARGESPAKRVIKPAPAKKTERQLAKDAALAAAAEEKRLSLLTDVVPSGDPSATARGKTELMDLPQNVETSINVPIESTIQANLHMESLHKDNLGAEIPNKSEILKPETLKSSLELLSSVQPPSPIDVNDNVVSVTNGGNIIEMEKSFADQDDVIMKDELPENNLHVNDVEGEDVTDSHKPALAATIVEAVSSVQDEETSMAASALISSAPPPPPPRRRGGGSHKDETQRVFSEEYLRYKAEIMVSEATAKANVAAAEASFDDAVEAAARKKLEHRKLAAADRRILNAYHLSLGLTRPLSLAMPGPLLRLALVSHRCEIAIAKATNQEEMSSLSGGSSTLGTSSGAASLLPGGALEEGLANNKIESVEDKAVASSTQVNLDGRIGSGAQQLSLETSSSSSNLPQPSRPIRKVGNRWKGLAQPSEGWVFQF
jgi:hypothetical protein